VSYCNKVARKKEKNAHATAFAANKGHCIAINTRNLLHPIASFPIVPTLGFEFESVIAPYVPIVIRSTDGNVNRSALRNWDRCYRLAINAGQRFAQREYRVFESPDDDRSTAWDISALLQRTRGASLVSPGDI
jgi:hypothetical protein